MGLGDFVSGIFGSKNKEADQVNPYQTDSNAYQYGGQPGGAQRQAGVYGNTAGGYTNAANGALGSAAMSIGDARDTRNVQAEVLDPLRRRMNGQDLVATQVADQERRQLAAGQTGLAASARGPAALAAAQSNAAANTAQGTAQIGANEQINAANEKLANTNAFFNAATGIRSGDVATAGAATGLGGTAGNLGLGYSGLENNVNDAQLAAQMNKQAQDSANYNAAHGITAGAAGQNSSIAQQNGLGLVGAISSGAGVATGGGVPKMAARGGHIQGGAPYLVGERGPELVVPNKSGFVLTALQTAALRGAPPTGQQLAALHTRAYGGAMARAEGGPVAPVTWGVNPAPPPAPVAAAPQGYGAIGAPMMAQPTTGAGLSTPEQQELADRQQLSDRAAYEINRPYGGEISGMLDKRNRDTVATADKQRALGIAPEEPSEEEYAKATTPAERARLDDRRREALDAGAMERQARYGLGQGKKAEAGQQKAAEKDAQAYAKGHKLGSALVGAGNSLQSMAGNVDTGYHGPGDVAGPTLLALPSYQPRAEGGPMSSGTGPASAYVLAPGGGIDLGATAKQQDAVQMAGMQHPGSGGGFSPGSMLGAFGGFSKIAQGADTGYHGPGAIEAREEGGLISGLAAHAARAIHAVASGVADATKPEPIALDRKPARAAVTERTGYSATGTGHGSQVMGNSLVPPGPETAPKKVVSGERAKGGPIYAKKKAQPKKEKK